jgi:hypothetical protein
MTIKGPRLVDSDQAQAFLAELAGDPSRVADLIDGALAELSELPVGDDWKPRGAHFDDEMETSRELADTYVCGVLACGLVLGQEIGHHIFYTPGEAVLSYGTPGTGTLLRVADTLAAARTVFLFLDDYPYFDGFHDGHAEVLMHLIEMAARAATGRLREATEGEG